MGTATGYCGQAGFRTGVIFVTIGSTGSTSGSKDSVCLVNKMHLKASRRTAISQKLRRAPVKVADITGSW
jgi:hypothetical protein